MCFEDKDPGQGEAGLRGFVGRGEKGRGIEVTASPWRQDLASLGVRNHLRPDTESGNAAVWSGTASLEASLVAEASDWAATSRVCWKVSSASPTFARRLGVKLSCPKLKVT